MPYTKTEWKDHVVDQTTGQVIQQGTPVSASNLNKIEQGIYDAHQMLDKQNQQSVTIGHGLNIINANQNSPLDIRIEGRTLVNVSQNVLDPSKYYVLSDKKSKVKFADATTYTGVAKFQGKAEKPILIRIADFEGKVSGSTVENPHVFKGQNGNTLLAPSAFTVEAGTNHYGWISKLDGSITNFNTAATVNGQMGQHLFSFNLIEAIERNVGKIPANDTAGKVAWLKNNIAKLACNWWGYGQSPSGYKANLSLWRTDTTSWISPVYTTNSTPTKVSISTVNVSGTPSTAMNLTIDSNGFIHFLAYAEPSDGVTPSTIYTDYVELEIELNQNAQLWNPRFPLYEVDATEYANILTTWDENEVMRRYPMVESVQHVQNPYVIAEGENLIPPFTEWTLHANAVVKSPYELILNATGASQFNDILINVFPNQTYTLSVNMGSDSNHRARILDADTGSILASVAPPNTSVSVNVGNRNKVKVRLEGNNASGTFTFTNPMLNLGSTAKPFVPRNPSYLFAEVKLGSLADKKDILWKDGQDWKVTKWIEKDVVLDGSKAWYFGMDFTGYKRVSINPTNFLANKGQYTFVKYNGNILKNDSSYTNADQVYMTSDSAYIHLTVADSDSGWGETYTPSTNEIKAYFYGWRMCNGTYGQPYDGTGTKTWYPIGDTDLSRAVTTCPTSAAPTIAEGKIGYYKLSYVLSTPVTEVVTDKVEGDLVVNGATQIEVGSGVIVREKIVPVTASESGYYHINNETFGTVPQNRLKNRLSTLISIYRNGIKDNKWITRTNYCYGNQRFEIAKSDYDPTAEYTVTYLVLDRHLFTTNILAVTATYDSSLKSVVDSMVAKQSDIMANQSALIRSVAELYKRIKALGG
jgi:hypothetical protein